MTNKNLPHETLPPCTWETVYIAGVEAAMAAGHRFRRADEIAAEMATAWLNRQKGQVAA